MRGIVKWFNADKGYGFIEREPGNNKVGSACKDIFAHHTDIEMEGYRALVEGEEVEFVLVEDGPKGPVAKEIKRLDSDR